MHFKINIFGIGYDGFLIRDTNCDILRLSLVLREAVFKNIQFPYSRETSVLFLTLHDGFQQKLSSIFMIIDNRIFSSDFWFRL